jgi:hypothetical protein
MIKRFRILLIGIPILAADFGWNVGFGIARKAAVGPELSSPHLRTWWLMIAAAYAFLFAMTLGFLSLFLRLLHRQAPAYLKVACTANIFVAWLLLGLSTVVSDPAIVPIVSQVGLSQLANLLWFLGMAWWVPTLYILFRTVDVSAQTD